MLRSLSLALLFLSSSLFAQSPVVTSEVQRIRPTMSPQLTHFGRTIVQDGDRVAIGATAAYGEVETYTFDGTDWNFEQGLLATGGGSNEAMGTSLDLEGDLLLTGAPWSSSFSGAAYVFRRVGGVWVQEQRLVHPTAQSSYQFGIDVDLDGDQLAVGGLIQQLGSGQGVFVYQYNGSSWVLEQEVPHTASLAGPRYGRGVQLMGDTLYVSDLNRVHIFERGVAGWTQVGQVDPPASAILPPGNTILGRCVDRGFQVSGDRMLISHPGGAFMPGSCTPFTRVGGVWTAGASFDSGSPQIADYFGLRFSFEGEWLLVGAPGRDLVSQDGLLEDAGTAFLFREIAGTWTRVDELTPRELGIDGYAGSDVSVDAGRLLVGSWIQDTTNFHRGAVHSFDVAADLIGTSTCFGDGSGCTTCACGNNAPAGSLGGCLNGEGRAARLSATGNPSEMNDTLRFDLAGASSEAFALLFAGGQLLPVAGACPPGSGITDQVLDGLRCAGGGTLRLGTRPLNVLGSTVRPWGGRTNDLLTLGGFVSGQTWHFQATYRDSLSTGCGTGLNTSQAVSVTIVP